MPPVSFVLCCASFAVAPDVGVLGGWIPESWGRKQDGLQAMLTVDSCVLLPYNPITASRNQALTTGRPASSGPACPSQNRRPQTARITFPIGLLSTLLSCIVNVFPRFIVARLSKSSKLWGSTCLLSDFPGLRGGSFPHKSDEAMWGTLHSSKFARRGKSPGALNDGENHGLTLLSFALGRLGLPACPSTRLPVHPPARPPARPHGNQQSA
ncbi:hypothetical protein BJ170DRAFT_716577 [Xylariales sp. AK1849]|nr:hypothetical protein BJ170DRAFT_716577 [Xylariales sp. AK1849]